MTIKAVLLQKMLQWIKRRVFHLLSFKWFLRKSKDLGLFQKYWKSKDLSKFQRYCPALLRIFIVLNYLYFTYFLFSLAWTFIRHSLLKCQRESCYMSDSSNNLRQLQTRQQRYTCPFQHNQDTQTLNCLIAGNHLQNPHPCKILNSLQKLRQFNENIHSFWKEQLEMFYNCLINVFLMYFHTSGHTEHLDANSEEIKGITNPSDANSVTHKEKIKPCDRNKSEKRQRSKCKLYDVYHAKVTTRNPFDAKEEKAVKKNDRKSKRKTIYHNVRSDLKVEKECLDCNKIKTRAGIQHRSKNKFHNQRTANEESCKVIYYGPYASKKRANLKKYTHPGEGKIINNCNVLPKENNKKYSTSSIEFRSTKFRADVHQKTVDKKHKGKAVSMKERESKYFSEDETTPFNSKTSFESQVPGLPLARIDPNDKSFMTNSSVKQFYKKLKRGSTINVNHNLLSGITDVLSRVSKSIKPELKCCRKRYRIFR